MLTHSAVNFVRLTDHEYNIGSHFKENLVFGEEFWFVFMKRTKVKVKIKFTLEQAMKARGGVEV
jgi:hypothetical protein